MPRIANFPFHFICASVIFTGFCGVCDAEAPLASSIHTLSIHVDGPESFNALFNLAQDRLQLPVLYGMPVTAERTRRRNYAGFWLGNVVLEICGPYAGETFPDAARARLHGLTLRPNGSLAAAVAGLDKMSVAHGSPFCHTSGKPEDSVEFVVLEDAGLVTPHLAVSFMEVRNRDREKGEQGAAAAALLASDGGALGIKRVREIQISVPHTDAQAKWRQLMNPVETGAGGPALQFLKGGSGAITALVIEVESLDRAAGGLAEQKLMGGRTRDTVELDAAKALGIRIVFTVKPTP